MTYDAHDRTARDLANHAQDAARDTQARYGSASRALQGTGGDVSATLENAADSLSGRIQEQPLAAILIAAAIGYIVGRIGRHI